MLIGQTEFALSGHAHDYAQLQSLLQLEPVSIILLDLNLKKEDGFSILQKINKECPSIRVVIFTMYEEVYLIEKALKLGAAGFLLKNMANDELHNALRHVTTSPDFYLQSNLKKQHQENTTFRDGFVQRMHLSPREIEIIRFVAQGKSAKEIADELFLSLHTVDTHRRNILVKLNLKNIADLTRFAFENHLL